MVVRRNALLLSIRPEYAKRILAGSKTVELRRTRPRITEGDLAYVYASSPQMALVGAFEVAGLIQGPPAALWRKASRRAGISRQEFDGYFAGAAVAYGILVGEVRRLAPPVPLDGLRKKLPGFRPPQSFCYLDAAEVSDVLSCLPAKALARE